MRAKNGTSLNARILFSKYPAFNHERQIYPERSTEALCPCEYEDFFPEIGENLRRRYHFIVNIMSYKQKFQNCKKLENDSQCSKLNRTNILNRGYSTKCVKRTSEIQMVIYRPEDRTFGLEQFEYLSDFTCVLVEDKSFLSSETDYNYDEFPQSESMINKLFYNWF